MNTRKIKLALTAGLINKNVSGNALQAVEELMTSFADEVGAFMGLKPVGHSSLDRNSIRERYALQYENGTLNVEVISHPGVNRQSVQRFQFLAAA